MVASACQRERVRKVEPGLSVPWHGGRLEEFVALFTVRPGNFSIGGTATSVGGGWSGGNELSNVLVGAGLRRP